MSFESLVLPVEGIDVEHVFGERGREQNNNERERKRRKIAPSLESSSHYHSQDHSGYRAVLWPPLVWGGRKEERTKGTNHPSLGVPVGLASIKGRSGKTPLL